MHPNHHSDTNIQHRWVRRLCAKGMLQSNFFLKIFWQILVQEKLLSLMVTQEDNTIGILRLADVFAAVYHTMAECNN
jgi:hypothetical protein